MNYAYFLLEELPTGGGSPITADGTWTEGADLVAASGTVAWIGTAAWTEGKDVLAASGSVRIDSSGAWVEIQDAIAASGTVSQPAVTGVAALVERQDIWNGQADNGAVQQGGHFLPLTEKQLREQKKRDRRDRQLRDDLDESRRMDALGIEADIRTILAPKAIEQQNPVNYTTDSVDSDEDDAELELLLLHA